MQRGQQERHRLRAGVKSRLNECSAFHARKQAMPRSMTKAGEREKPPE